MLNVEGDFELFATAFPNRLVPDVIRMILHEWPTCPRPTKKPLENRITNRFVAHLQSRMRNYERPAFKFGCRPKLPDANSDSELGEIDVEVTSFSNHPDAFLSIECKRLNVQKKDSFASGGGEYVGAGGMGCFTSGQYRSGGNTGAMVGYVMTRTIADAMASINEQLKCRGKDLMMGEPFKLQPSSIVPDEDCVKQTSHDLESGQFEIVHAFLQFSNVA
jgi:hypothetical protein